MRRFLLRFLIFLNLVYLNFSCNSYSHMQKIQTDNSCVLKFKPDFNHVIFKTSAEATGKHFSGLLLVKSMPDSSTRIQFSSETGLSFFDFGFLSGNGFNVYQIIPDLNNKALIKTLRKDFELVLFRNMDSSDGIALSDGNLLYHRFPQAKGVNYFVTDDSCRNLIKMQRASNTKPVMEARIFNDGSMVPDSISIRHLNFNFSISLKKITTLAPE